MRNPLKRLGVESRGNPVKLVQRLTMLENLVRDLFAGHAASPRPARDMQGGRMDRMQQARHTNYRQAHSAPLGKFAMRYRIHNLAILVVLIAIAGCPMDPQNQQLAPNSFDGEWRLVYPSGGDVCLTFLQGVPVIVDAGCNGISGLLYDATPIAITGDRILYSFTTTIWEGFGPVVRATFDLHSQGDGTYAGEIAAFVFETAETYYDEAVMVPN